MTDDETDARRYRWLASQAQVLSAMMDGKHHWSLPVRGLIGPDFDRAVDLARERAHGIGTGEKND